MISAFLAAGLAITAPVVAAQRPSVAAPGPFGKLFLLPGQPGYEAPRIVKQAAALAATGTPSVSCGTTMVPVNPAFDVRMRRNAPTDPKPQVRAMQAPPCETVTR